MRVLAVLSLVAFGVFSQASQFQISPYVYLGKDKIDVAWQVAGEPIHRQLLSRLPCGQTLSYEVMGLHNTVQSIPCPQDGYPVSFTFLADTQEGIGTDKQFVNLVKSLNTDAIVVGGDLVQRGGKDAEWVDFFEMMKDLSSHLLMIPVVGNHEYRKDATASHWKRYFDFDASEGFHSTWLGPVHLIILNSCFEDDPSLVLKQVAWLQGALSQPAAWKVVVFHHAPFSKSVMYMPTYPRKEYKVLRDLYLPLFETYGVNLVLNGHTHIFEHSLHNGIHYVTTGAAGGKMGAVGTENQFELTADQIRTMVQIQASSTMLYADIIGLDGTSVDRLVLRR